jgi:hypothetical protein
MLKRDDILRPLGGEDNLRLMCNADGFEYTDDWGRSMACNFLTPEHNVWVVYYIDVLDRKPRWSLSVRAKGEIVFLHRSSSIQDFGLVARIFEWSTHYALEF